MLAAAGRVDACAGAPAADDIRRAVRVGREGNLVIFVVDASGSMAARDRMAAVGGAALSLLRDAYQRRDKVAVITFRGDGARGVTADDVGAHRFAPTDPVRHRRHHTAGQGLLAARDLVVRERVRDRARRPRWWCSPTAGPPAARIRWAAADPPPPGWWPRARGGGRGL